MRKGDSSGMRDNSRRKSAGGSRRRHSASLFGVGALLTALLLCQTSAFAAPFPAMSAAAAASSAVPAAGEVPDEFLMPGAADDRQLFAADSSRFGFGAPEGDKSFVNRYVGYRMQIPAGFRFDYGRRQLAERYYTPEDALRQEGAAIDLMVVSDELTEEQPDPEQLNDNAMVLLGFYIPAARADGSPMDAQAYVYSLFTKALGGSQLLNYIEAEDSQLAGQTYRHFTLDYTTALQQLYRSRYTDGKEHPAFDEHFDFRLEAYVRRIGETYYVFYTLRSGTKYASATDLMTYIGGLS